MFSPISVYGQACISCAHLYMTKEEGGGIIRTVYRTLLHMRHPLSIFYCHMSFENTNSLYYPYTMTTVL